MENGFVNLLKRAMLAFLNMASLSGAKNKVDRQSAPLILEEEISKLSSVQLKGNGIEDLIESELVLIQDHPDRAILVLLLASESQNKGDLVKTRKLIELSRIFGCDEKLINQVILSSAYDILAGASTLANRLDLADRQKKIAMRLSRTAEETINRACSDVKDFQSISSLFDKNLISSFLGSKPDELLEPVVREGLNEAQNNQSREFSLYEILHPQRLTEVVDIGANPIDGVAPYQKMLDQGLCRVTGYEPNKKAFEELMRNKGANEEYYDYVIGDGSQKYINFYKASGMSSLFEVDESKLDFFKFFSSLCELKSRDLIETRRIDDAKEITFIDMLKIDIQGGELMAMKSGQEKLSNAVAIQTEISFVALYKEQPIFGEIDIYLRKNNFLPHCFVSIKRWPISPYLKLNSEKEPLNQLLEADIVYIKDITNPSLFSDEQLKHLSLIAHYCYSSFDLALRCINILVERNTLDPSVQDIYKKQIQSL